MDSRRRRTKIFADLLLGYGRRSGDLGQSGCLYLVNGTNGLGGLDLLTESIDLSYQSLPTHRVAGPVGLGNSQSRGNSIESGVLSLNQSLSGTLFSLFDLIGDLTEEEISENLGASAMLYEAVDAIGVPGEKKIIISTKESPTGRS